MIEEKAIKAKEATNALVTVIKSCEGPYDERIMEPLNDFLTTTADFKSFAENQLSSEGSRGPNTLAFLEEKINLLEKEIQDLVEEKFSDLLKLDDQVKHVESEIALYNSIKACGDVEKLLSFIQRASPFYRCPIGWKPGESMGASKAPYPTEEMMRASHLFQRSLKKKPLVELDTTKTAVPSAQRDLARRPEDIGEELIDLDLNPDLL